MATTGVNKAVDALVNAKADAYSNMYDVWVQFPWESSFSLVSVRADGFEPPEASIETDKKEYHGNEIERPKPQVKQEKKFSITFSLDASYNLYGQFKIWQSQVVDPVNGGSANWAAVMGNIKIKALAGAYIPSTLDWAANDGSLFGSGSPSSTDSNATWEYENIYVTKVGEPKFKREGSERLSYQVDFIFDYDAHEPFFNGKGLTNA
jgi:hypothetical protein